jgi:hypothetical protein
MNFKNYEEFLECKDISEHIFEHKKNGDDTAKIRIDAKEQSSQALRAKDFVIRIIKHDPFILILDSLKKFFGIPYTPKREVIMFGQKYIIMECDNEESIQNMDIKKLYEDEKFVKQIQRLFAFKYLMCLTCNFENKIDVIDNKDGTYTPVSYKENNYTTDFNSKASRIPKTIIEKWFEAPMLQETKKELAAMKISAYYSPLTSLKNKEIKKSGDECFYDTVKELCSMIDSNSLKIMLQDLITQKIKSETHNPKIRELFWWSNAVFEKFRQY